MNDIIRQIEELNIENSEITPGNKSFMIKQTYSGSYRRINAIKTGDGFLLSVFDSNSANGWKYQKEVKTAKAVVSYVGRYL